MLLPQVETAPATPVCEYSHSRVPLANELEELKQVNTPNLYVLVVFFSCTTLRVSQYQKQ